MAEDKKQQDSECVKVAVRTRPMNSKEIERGKHLSIYLSVQMTPQRCQNP